MPRRLLALLFAAALLLPALASAQTLEADLDGDGIRDRVERGTGSPELVIRFSSRSLPHRLHARGTVERIAAIDFDHDGDADILATTDHNRLTIWLNEGRGRFRTLHARHVKRHDAARTRVRETVPGASSDDTCDGGSIGLTPLVPVVRRSRAGAVLARGTSAPPIRFRPRGSAPRGPPPVRFFS